MDVLGVLLDRSVIRDHVFDRERGLSARSFVGRSDRPTPTAEGRAEAEGQRARGRGGEAGRRSTPRSGATRFRTDNSQTRAVKELTIIPRI